MIGITNGPRLKNTSVSRGAVWGEARVFLGNHSKQQSIVTLRNYFFQSPRLFKRLRSNLRVHLSTYLHTRNFHGYFEIWTPFSSSRLVRLRRLFFLRNLLNPQLWRKNSNFEPKRSKLVSDFSSRSTAADKELHKLRTRTHAQDNYRYSVQQQKLLSQREGWRSGYCLLEGRSNAARNCQRAAWVSLLPSCVSKMNKSPWMWCYSLYTEQNVWKWRRTCCCVVVI